MTRCVTNPNPDTLAFRRIRVALDAAGSPLLEGTSEAPVVLLPRSSTLVPFSRSGRLDLLQAGQQLADAAQPGTLRCAMRG